jgi:uncharacterized membrane protein YoaK (UPF0700 family)
MNGPTKTDEILEIIVFFFIVPFWVGCLCSYLTYTVFPSSSIWQVVFLLVPLLILYFCLFGDSLSLDKQGPCGPK